MNLRVKPLKKREIPAAARLCRDVFDQFVAPACEREGADAFHRFVNPLQLGRLFESGCMIFFGAFGEETLAGAAALRGENHLSLLFVLPEYQRRGVGAALLKACEARVKKAGNRVFTVNASPGGLSFYRAMGFHPTGPEQLTDGIRYTPMEKEL